MSIAATYNETGLVSSAIYSLGSNIWLIVLVSICSTLIIPTVLFIGQIVRFCGSKDFSYEDKNPVYVLLIELGLFITGTLLLMKEWINNKHFVIDLKDMKGKSKRFVVHI